MSLTLALPTRSSTPHGYRHRSVSRHGLFLAACRWQLANAVSHHVGHHRPRRASEQPGAAGGGPTVLQLAASLQAVAGAHRAVAGYHALMEQHRSDRRALHALAAATS